MVYYNEIINALGDEQIDLEYFLHNISKITHILKDHYTLPTWFLELLGQTQLELIDSNHFSKRISFMCDVLIVTLVSISHQNIFLENFKNYSNNSYMETIIKLLPQSFVVILKEEKWNKYITQVLEWLYYMVNYETTPFLYRKGFYQSLIALRHEPEFKSTLKWFKYIGCRCLKE
nr:uncharacterized protein LOC111416225 [Onthophagus taurus]